MVTLDWLTECVPDCIASGCPHLAVSGSDDTDLRVWRVSVCVVRAKGEVMVMVMMMVMMMVKNLNY